MNNAGHNGNRDNYVWLWWRKDYAWLNHLHSVPTEKGKYQEDTPKIFVPSSPPSAYHFGVQLMAQVTQITVDSSARLVRPTIFKMWGKFLCNFYAWKWSSLSDGVKKLKSSKDGLALGGNGNMVM